MDFSLHNGNKILKGTLGGWVESEKNLSQEGTCWINDEAMVFNNAKIIDSAIMSDFSVAKDNAVVAGYSNMTGNSIICNSARIGAKMICCGEAHDNSIICDNAIVLGRVEGFAKVCNNAIIDRNSIIKDNACVGTSIQIKGSSIVGKNSLLKGNDSSNIVIKDSYIMCGSNLNVISVLFSENENKKQYKININNENIFFPDQIRIIPIKTFSSKNIALTVSPKSWSVENFYASNGKELLRKLKKSINLSEVSLIKNFSCFNTIYDHIDKKDDFTEVFSDNAKKTLNNILASEDSKITIILNKKHNTAMNAISLYYWAQLFGLIYWVKSFQDLSSSQKSKGENYFRSIINNSTLNIKSKEIIKLKFKFNKPNSIHSLCDFISKH